MTTLLTFSMAKGKKTKITPMDNDIIIPCVLSAPAFPLHPSPLFPQCYRSKRCWQEHGMVYHVSCWIRLPNFSCQFINTAVGDTVTPVDHGIFSCTKDIMTISAVDPRDENRRIVFVDTPGFDHTSISDKEILKSLGGWLRKT
jgi:hypothetical protein